VVIFGCGLIHIKFVLNVFSVQKLELREPVEKLFEVHVPFFRYLFCLYFHLTNLNKLK